MVTKKAGVVQKFHNRPGEGYSVDLTMITTDQGSVTGSLDLTTLPVPDRRFSCDAVGLQVDGPVIKLLFAQRKPIGSGLLSMLVINMAPESVQQFMNVVNDDFATKYAEFAKNLPESKITEFDGNADQSVVLSSSVVMAGYSGSNGCMDFYYASPFAVQQLATLRKLSLEAVVRVNLPSGAMFALLDALKQSAERFPWLKGLK